MLMARITLKKLLKKKEITRLLERVLSAVDGPVSVQDTGGGLLLGDGSEDPVDRHRVEVGGDVIGWVCGGGRSATAVAALLGHLAQGEVEKKSLARETLEKYRELTLLYSFAEKIATHLEPDEIARLTLDEIGPLIRADTRFVMLRDPETGELSPLAAQGKRAALGPAMVPPDDGIARDVLTTGRGEIVNEAASDKRYPAGPGGATSLMYAPLKTKERTLGLVGITAAEPVSYTAGDLMILTAVASQSASAIENAILHESKLKQEQVKSSFGRFFIIAVVLIAMSTLIPNTAGSSPMAQMAYSWASLMILLLPILYLVLKMGAPITELGVTTRGWKKAVLEGVLFSAGLAVVMTGIRWYLAGRVGEPLITWKLKGHYGSVELAICLSTYVAHSAIQEFIARGVLQGSLQRFISEFHFMVPIVIASMTFGIAHVHISLFSAAMTFIFSMIFGMVYYRHGNLFGVTLMHYALGILSMAYGYI